MSGPVKEEPKEALYRRVYKRLKDQTKTMSTLFFAMARRPLLWLAGILVCGLALLVETAVGQPGQAIFNLASYIPFLGGGWAVYAYTESTKQKDKTFGHFPSRKRIMSFALAALMVLMLSGLARVTLTIVGELIVKTALALGPTVALSEQIWPPSALWRGLMVIDEYPREFGKMLLISVGILLLTVLAVPLALNVAVGSLSGGHFVQGLARGLGWAIISAMWMMFYLRVRLKA